MALLVNYEGTYLPPQKLWYLVDGVWTEVKQVFENNAQNELAILDQERIKQDQVVAALNTKVTELMARLDGTDPTIPLETDPTKIDNIVNQLDILSLQLDIAKTEQVVMTKNLFEQKAQLEYIKLVGEGEQALSKIATNVTNPVEWQVIRIAPQSTLDERLEVVIQQGLETNDRIFNYGLVYYRLFKVNSSDQNDDPEYLATEFKRRLAKNAYTNNVPATNYVFTIDSVQNVYTEVNQFVNSGAKRIEDYLASIRDQQKFILDSIEQAKESMAELEQAATDGKIQKTEDGKILTLATKDNLQVPLGDKLLSYQNVTSFDQLVSTQVLNDIANGIKDIADYPGITKLNQDATALNEKIQAIQTFQSVNEAIQTDLVSGKYVFNLNVFSAKKTSLTAAKNLFWTTPLGDSTVSNSGGSLTYRQTYTSSGTYKFKNNELVTLSTTYKAIINALLAGKDTISLGVTFTAGEQPKLIQVLDGEIYVYGEESPVISKTNQKAIINVKNANTKEINFSGGTNGNTKNQPHNSIIFVKENTTFETDPNVELKVYHPVLNGLFYANTVEIDLRPNVLFTVPEYEYAYNIHQVPAAETPSSMMSQSFSFNAAPMPLPIFYPNDNIISQLETPLVEMAASSFSFNAFVMSLPIFYPNDNIISQIQDQRPILEALEDIPTIVFNPKAIPLSEVGIISSKSDNIVELLEQTTESLDKAFTFNTFMVNSYERIKNGYSTSVGSNNNIFEVGTLASAPGLSLITYNLESSTWQTSNPETGPLDKFQEIFITGSYKAGGELSILELGQKTRNIISFQTGLAPHEFSYPDDTLNKLVESVPRMLTAINVRIYEPDYTKETLNALKDPYESVARVSTLISSRPEDLSKDQFGYDSIDGIVSGNAEIINALYRDITQVSSLLDSEPFLTEVSNKTGSELLNKDISSLPTLSRQLNPGIQI